MAQNYDPLDIRTWPDEQKDFAGRVWRGLNDGDLQPLADYLRAGHYIDPSLARCIADAIEGRAVGSYHIVTKGRFRGQRGMTESWEQHDRRMAIGVFMEWRQRALGKGGYEAALAETKARFEISSSATVSTAQKYVRNHVAAMTSELDDSDRWYLMFAIHLNP